MTAHGGAPADPRPRLAAALAALRASGEPVWVTWQGKRLLLGLPDEAWLARGVGLALVATRRGYRRVELVGRVDDGGHGTSKRGAPKHLPLRTEDDYFNPLSVKQVRAVILEEHER